MTDRLTGFAEGRDHRGMAQFDLWQSLPGEAEIVAPRAPARDCEWPAPGLKQDVEIHPLIVARRRTLRQRVPTKVRISSAPNMRRALYSTCLAAASTSFSTTRVRSDAAVRKNHPGRAATHRPVGKSTRARRQAGSDRKKVHYIVVVVGAAVSRTGGGRSQGQRWSIP